MIKSFESIPSQISLSIKSGISLCNLENCSTKKCSGLISFSFLIFFCILKRESSKTTSKATTSTPKILHSMKTIVIIENEAIELKALITLFEQWQKEINILTAREERAAITIMSQHQVDLVVCDLALLSGSTLDDFSLLTHTFPYIPCIALSSGNGFIPEEVLRRGASHCLEKPVNTSKLLMHAGELLDTATSGTVKGIPIHSLLQMLESEEKTCTLQVNRKNDSGLLYVKNGVLIGAETKNFVGEDAAHLILSWQETVVRIQIFQRPA